MASPFGGDRRFLGRVFGNPTVPTSTGVFYSVHPVSVTGTPAEGAAATLTDDTTTVVPVAVFGTAAPTAGTLLVYQRAADRWVAEYDPPPSSGPTHSFTGCPCTAIPDTIDMHVASPSSGGDQMIFPAALRYQAKPSDLKSYTSDPNGYYSDAVFTSTSGNYVFRYWFGCTQGQYFVSGLMLPSSPVGYPGRFLVQTWLAGLPGNTCTPFSLTNGSTGNTAFRSMGISINGTGPP